MIEIGDTVVIDEGYDGNRNFHFNKFKGKKLKVVAIRGKSKCRWSGQKGTLSNLVDIETGEKYKGYHIERFKLSNDPETKIAQEYNI